MSFNSYIPKKVFQSPVNILSFILLNKNNNNNLPFYFVEAAGKGDLRICRLSQIAGTWKGGDEIILLCEKVQKGK